VYTGDVGIGHVRAAERGRLGERYLLTGRNVSLHDFAHLVARTAGVRPPWLKISYRMALATAQVSEALARLTRTQPLLPREVVYTARLGQRLDGGKAQRELGLPPTPLEEAVRRAVRWFHAHGYLWYTYPQPQGGGDAVRDPGSAVRGGHGDRRSLGTSD
jgi:dihydroflavonol-4-reductase